MAPIDAPPPDPSSTPPPVVETVTVRAARLPPALGDKAFSIVRLDRSDLEDAPRLDTALEQVPGVSLFRRASSLSANPTTQGLSLRAIAPSGSSRALITLDGVPQNDPFGGWVIWSALPAEDIEAVNIVRGAGAGPYGAGALTGVVALEERTPKAGDWSGDAAGGSLGYARAAGVAEMSAGPGELFAEASGESSDGWIPVHASRGFADTPLSLHDRQGALRWTEDLGGGVLAARAGAYDEDRGTGTRGGTAHANGTDESLSWARAPDASAYGYRLQVWARQSNFSQLSLSDSPGHTSATPADQQYATPAQGVGFNAAIRRATDAWSWELGADAREAEGETREHFKFVSGAFTENRIAGGKAGVAGVYAEGARTEGPWLFTAGVRVDGWRTWDGKRIEALLSNGAATLDDKPADRSGVTPTARAGLTRDLGDGFYARAAAYAGFRPPTLNELHRPFRVGNTVTEANPALEPERLFGAEVGVGRTTSASNVEATVFVNRLEDAVTNVTLGVGPGTFPKAGFIPAGGVFQMRENAGAVQATGLEFDARHKFMGDRLVLRAALSATDARVDGGDQAPQLTGKRPAEAPIWTATAGAQWRASERLSVDVDARYESKRFEDDLNTRVIRAALVTDARVNWTLSPRAEVFLAAENLFNTNEATAVGTDGVVSYAAPRILSVGVSIRR
ncbi:MAG TPA: TonB-dependent receptor [Caulobacteraceae bacterium]|jgi:outer membrane receptor protein involved in Fe transport|nr:TonB-dependent receptor [Caulobacteraceae bacterium]